MCDQASKCKFSAKGRSYCSWEDEKHPVFMAAKVVEGHSLKLLFVKDDVRGTSGQTMRLRWHCLRKDEERATFPFSKAQDAKLKSAVFQQLLWSTHQTPIAKSSGPMTSKFKSVYKEVSRGACLRLSRINRDSCRVLKVRKLIYHGFKRVSCGVLC